MKTTANTTRGLVLKVLRLAMAALLVFSFPLGVSARGPQEAPRASQALLRMADEKPNERVRVIVQRRGNANGFEKQAKGKGGEKVGELGLINAVVMELPAQAVRAMATHRDVQWISQDAPLMSTTTLQWGTPAPTNTFLETVEMDHLLYYRPWASGYGVGVAIIDSGISSNGSFDCRLVTNFVSNSNSWSASDDYGHGTHVAGIVGSAGWVSSGLYKGVATKANLINVKVSDSQGRGYASDLINGLQWVYENKDAHNIRVANISLNSTVAQSYKVDPICAAVEMLWFRGITVVVSAGNNGNAWGESVLYPPANDPFVITVGATDEHGIPWPDFQDRAEWSAYGTTFEGYSKPDVVAPGVDIVSLLANTMATVWQEHPVHRLPDPYMYSHFRMSGTSMSAPIVSGIAALMIQDKPWLRPDQVKQGLMDTAFAMDDAGTGAGSVTAYYAGFWWPDHSGEIDVNDGIEPNLLIQEWLVGALEGSVNWDSVNWDSVNWDSVNWDSVNWDSVNWDSVNWDSVNWDSVNWDSVNWDSVNWDSVAWDD